MSLIKNSPLIAGSILATTMFSAGAFASATNYLVSNRVEFSVNANASTCKLDISDSNIRVDFGTLTTAGRNNGDVLAKRAIRIHLTGCAQQTRQTMTTKFDGPDMGATGLITPDPTGGTGNQVNFEIINSGGTEVAPDTVTTGAVDSTDSDAQQTTMDQTYYLEALYNSSGTTVGSESAYINFTVTDS